MFSYILLFFTKNISFIIMYISIICKTSLILKYK